MPSDRVPPPDSGTIQSVELHVVKGRLSVSVRVRSVRFQHDDEVVRIIEPRVVDAILPVSVLLGENRLVTNRASVLSSMHPIAERMLVGRTVTMSQNFRSMCYLESWVDVVFSDPSTPLLTEEQRRRPRRRRPAPVNVDRLQPYVEPAGRGLEDIQSEGERLRREARARRNARDRARRERALRAAGGQEPEDREEVVSIRRVGEEPVNLPF
jgi:hypothetical protein